MYTQKDHDLVNRLLTAARDGKTEWLPTAYENVFTTSLSGKYSFQVRHNFLSTPHFYLSIHDEEGKVIHNLTSDDYPDLEELHELARRRALKIDNTIDDILTELDAQ